MKPVRLAILNLVIIIFSISNSFAQNADSLFIAENYFKKEYRIPMRDGITLFTQVYIPRDTSKKYPIMLNRTPYNIDPYGEDSYPNSLGPSKLFDVDKFIFVYQDVRGRFMSEGDFVDVRPNRNDPDELDESRDTYDTIEWLLKNLEYDNGKVGMWGISYPGFYSSAASIDAHPALVAVSPQAPIADWFIGDDFHHNGAFWLPHAFNFYSVFGKKREGLTTEWGPRFDHGTPDGYKFFLEMGPLKNANEKYLKNEIAFWNQVMKHGTYDEFWQERNLLPHLRNIKPAMLVVGGWFDAENLYGALNTYKTIEERNPNVKNNLVMGPWFHGGWARSSGDYLGNIDFESATSKYYQEEIEFPFFKYHLKGEGNLNLAEANVFETGSNKWKKYSQWPPEEITVSNLYLNENSALSFIRPEDKNSYDEYVSDPDKPVPFTNEIVTRMTREYMVEDQRFASRRPDVLVYETETLESDITVAGPFIADLFISTNATDADFVVKLIDVFPDTLKSYGEVQYGGFQMMVRGDVMRAKFRYSYEDPQPLDTTKVNEIKFKLNDVNHTFKKGHRIMVQIQSSWFPLVDRNPQKFIDIYSAGESDFQKANIKIHHSSEYPSHLKLPVLEK